jgi:hypothetical protein
MELERAIFALGEDAVEHERVEVDVQPKSAAETLVTRNATFRRPRERCRYRKSGRETPQSSWARNSAAHQPTVRDATRAPSAAIRRRFSAGAISTAARSWRRIASGS